MIELEDVHKWFGSVHAVDGITLSLPASRIVGLLGPNGAGKTTTIRMIVGFLMPDRGRVLVSGHDTAESIAASRRLIGYMPESSPIYPEMRALEFLNYRAGLYQLAAKQRNINISKVISWCGLAGMERRRVNAMSKGYKQRLALAAALLHDPPVLILDEPTNGLDPGQIGEVRALVKQLGQERTMLVSSHILPEIERLCDSAVIIAGGKVQAQGTLAEVASAGERAAGEKGRSACQILYYVDSAATYDDVHSSVFVQKLRHVQGVTGVDMQLERNRQEDVPRNQHKQSTVSITVRVKNTEVNNANQLCHAIAVLAAANNVILHEIAPHRVSLERAFAQLVGQEVGAQ